MSSSVQRNFAAPTAPIVSNRHRVERGAVAALGVASIYQGGKGLIGDCKKWRETTTVVEQTLAKPVLVRNLDQISAEEAGKLPADTVFNSNGVSFQIDNTTPPSLHEAGTTISREERKPPLTKRQHYLQLASVVSNLAKIGFGLAALNASRK